MEGCNFDSVKTINTTTDKDISSEQYGVLGSQNCESIPKVTPLCMFSHEDALNLKKEPAALWKRDSQASQSINSESQHRINVQQDCKSSQGKEGMIRQIPQIQQRIFVKEMTEALNDVNEQATSTQLMNVCNDRLRDDDAGQKFTHIENLMTHLCRSDTSTSYLSKEINTGHNYSGTFTTDHINTKMAEIETEHMHSSSRQKDPVKTMTKEIETRICEKQGQNLQEKPYSASDIVKAMIRDRKEKNSYKVSSMFQSLADKELKACPETRENLSGTLNVKTYPGFIPERRRTHTKYTRPIPSIASTVLRNNRIEEELGRSKMANMSKGTHESPTIPSILRRSKQKYKSQNQNKLSITIEKGRHVVKDKKERRKGRPKTKTMKTVPSSGSTIICNTNPSEPQQNSSIVLFSETFQHEPQLSSNVSPNDYSNATNTTTNQTSNVQIASNMSQAEKEHVSRDGLLNEDTGETECIPNNGIQKNTSDMLESSSKTDDGSSNRKVIMNKVRKAIMKKPRNAQPVLILPKPDLPASTATLQLLPIVAQPIMLPLHAPSIQQLQTPGNVLFRKTHTQHDLLSIDSIDPSKHSCIIAALQSPVVDLQITPCILQNTLNQPIQNSHIPNVTQGIDASLSFSEHCTSDISPQQTLSELKFEKVFPTGEFASETNTTILDSTTEHSKQLIPMTDDREKNTEPSTMTTDNSLKMCHQSSEIEHVSVKKEPSDVCSDTMSKSEDISEKELSMHEPLKENGSNIEGNGIETEQNNLNLVVKSVYSLASKTDDSSNKLRKNKWYMKKEISHFVNKSKRYMKLLGVKNINDFKDPKLHLPCFVVLDIDKRGFPRTKHGCNKHCKQSVVNNLCTKIARDKIFRTKRQSRHEIKERIEIPAKSIKPQTDESEMQDGDDVTALIPTREIMRLLQHILFVNMCENVTSNVNTHLPTDIKELIQLFPTVSDETGNKYAKINIANSSILINSKELESGNLSEIFSKKFQQNQVGRMSTIGKANQDTDSEKSDYSDDFSVVLSDSSDDDSCIGELKQLSNLSYNLSFDRNDPTGLISQHTYYARSSSPWSDISDIDGSSADTIAYDMSTASASESIDMTSRNSVLRNTRYKKTRKNRNSNINNIKGKPYLGKSWELGNSGCSSSSSSLDEEAENYPLTKKYKQKRCCGSDHDPTLDEVIRNLQKFKKGVSKLLYTISDKKERQILCRKGRRTHKPKKQRTLKRATLYRRKITRRAKPETGQQAKKRNI